jgi:hypothetical protein
MSSRAASSTIGSPDVAQEGCSMIRLGLKISVATALALTALSAAG